MVEAIIEAEDEIKKQVKSDCPSCKSVGVDFIYLGNYLDTFTPRSIEAIGGIKAIKKQYGDKLFLYGCNSCRTSQTLDSLKPYS